MSAPPAKVDPLFFQLFDIKPRKGDVKKAQIIQAAIDCMATRGIEELTFEAIGKALRLGRSHIAYYFPDKNQLIEAAFRFMVGTAQTLIIERIRDEKTDRGRLKGYIEGTFEWIERYPRHVAILPLFFYYCSLNKDLAVLFRQAQDAGRERILQIIRPVLTRKKASATDMVQIADSIQALCVIGFLESIVRNTPKDIAEIRARSIAVSLRMVS